MRRCQGKQTGWQFHSNFLFFCVHQALCMCLSKTCVFVLLSFFSLSQSLPTPRLYMHHLHCNCVYAVATYNALPCCFQWRLVPSHNPSTTYESLLSRLSLLLNAWLGKCICASVWGKENNSNDLQTLTTVCSVSLSHFLTQSWPLTLT